MHNLSDFIDISKDLIAKGIAYRLKMSELQVGVNSSLRIADGIFLLGIFIFLLHLMSEVLNIFGNNLTADFPCANSQQGGNLDDCVRQDMSLKFHLLVLLLLLSVVTQSIKL
jgi:hypothetical protein